MKLIGWFVFSGILHFIGIFLFIPSEINFDTHNHTQLQAFGLRNRAIYLFTTPCTVLKKPIFLLRKTLDFCNYFKTSFFFLQDKLIASLLVLLLLIIKPLIQPVLFKVISRNARTLCETNQSEQ